MIENSRIIPIPTEKSLQNLKGETEEQVISALAINDETAVWALISEMHHADIADLLERLNDEGRGRLLAIMGPEFDGDVLIELDETVRDQVISKIGLDTVAQAISELESDDALEIIAFEHFLDVHEAIGAILRVVRAAHAPPSRPPVVGVSVQPPPDDGVSLRIAHRPIRVLTGGSSLEPKPGVGNDFDARVFEGGHHGRRQVKIQSRMPRADLRIIVKMPPVTLHPDVCGIHTRLHKLRHFPFGVEVVEGDERSVGEVGINRQGPPGRSHGINLSRSDLFCPVRPWRKRPACRRHPAPPARF